MKSIKKAAVWLLLIALIAGLLSGCSKEKNTDNGTTIPESTVSEQTTETKETDATETTKDPDAVQTRPITNPSTSPFYEIGYTNVHLYTAGGGTVWMQAIAEILNTGTATISLDNATFDLQNTAGEVVASKGNVRAYPRILTTGEKGYFYIETPLSNVAADAQLILDPEVEINETAMVKHNLTAADTKLSTNALGDLTVTGTIENTTDQNFDNVYAVTILFDKNDTPIGMISSGATYSLSAGEKAQLQDSAFALPDNITKDTVGSFTVYAYALAAK